MGLSDPIERGCPLDMSLIDQDARLLGRVCDSELDMKDEKDKLTETAPGGVSPLASHSADRLRYALTRKSYRQGKATEAASLPSLPEYMDEVGRVLDRKDLTDRERILARAFAKAVYRRAIARLAWSDIHATIGEALTMARNVILKRPSHKAKRSTYAYESECASWERTCRKREARHGHGESD
jgi:hypothetical protein